MKTWLALTKPTRSSCAHWKSPNSSYVPARFLSSFSLEEGMFGINRRILKEVRMLRLEYCASLYIHISSETVFPVSRIWLNSTLAEAVCLCQLQDGMPGLSKCNSEQREIISSTPTLMRWWSNWTTLCYFRTASIALLLQLLMHNDVTVSPFLTVMVGLPSWPLQANSAWSWHTISSIQTSVLWLKSLVLKIY